MPRTRARSSRRTASLALRPLRRQSGVWLQADRLIRAAKAEVRPRRLCPVAPMRTRYTSVLAELRVGRTRALGEFRSDSIVERLPPTPTARRKIDFFRVCGGPALRVGCCTARAMRRMLHAACCPSCGGTLSATQ